MSSCQNTLSEKLKTQNLKVRFLKNKDELDDAGRLLYNVYIEELKWYFEINTPHRIRVDTLPDGSSILIDDYHYFTKWIGVYSNDQLIACLRVSPRVGKEQWLQTQYYQRKNIKLNTILDKEPRLVEASRAAVIKEFRGSGIFLLIMFKLLFSYACQNRLSIFFTTRLSSLIKLFVELGVAMIPGIHFKYEEQDPNSVVVFLSKFENNGILNVLNNIKTKVLNMESVAWKIDILV